MLGFEDEDGAGPSNPIPFEDEPNSGSEFAVEDAAAETPDELLYPEDDDEPDEPAFRSVSQRPIRPLPSKSKAKDKAKKHPPDTQRIASMQLGSSLSRGYTTNKMYALPTPSVHHRHRAVPLFFRSGRVERLQSLPKLFQAPEITSTNNFTFSPLVQDRVNKAWGYNIGSGPLWELLEDRGWYKEAIENGVEVEKEANRRPRVYVDIKVRSYWEVLHMECVSSKNKFIACDALISFGAGLHLHICPQTT
jgi:transcription factor C subunit 6